VIIGAHRAFPARFFSGLTGTRTFPPSRVLAWTTAPAAAVPETPKAKAKSRATKPRVAATAAKAAKKATPAKKAPKTATKAIPKAKASKPANPSKGTVREGSKSEKILALLKRADGVTLKELMKATGWQAHSVRGFLSAAIGKKMALRSIR